MQQFVGWRAFQSDNVWTFLKTVMKYMYLH